MEKKQRHHNISAILPKKNLNSTIDAIFSQCECFGTREELTMLQG
jgi:hypothetical protein